MKKLLYLNQVVHVLSTLKSKQKISNHMMIMMQIETATLVMN